MTSAGTRGTLIASPSLRPPSRKLNLCTDADHAFAHEKRGFNGHQQETICNCHGIKRRRDIRNPADRDPGRTVRLSRQASHYRERAGNGTSPPASTESERPNGNWPTQHRRAPAAIGKCARRKKRFLRPRSDRCSFRKPINSRQLAPRPSSRLCDLPNRAHRVAANSSAKNRCRCPPMRRHPQRQRSRLPATTWLRNPHRCLAALK